MKIKILKVEFRPLKEDKELGYWRVECEIEKTFWFKSPEKKIVVLSTTNIHKDKMFPWKCKWKNAEGKIYSKLTKIGRACTNAVNAKVLTELTSSGYWAPTCKIVEEEEEDPFPINEGIYR